jgi:hypothetical protein
MDRRTQKRGPGVVGRGERRYRLLPAVILAVFHTVGQVPDRRIPRAGLSLSLALYIIIYNHLESFWMVKCDCVYLHEFETGTEARMGIGMWMKFYVTERPHSALAGLTPD